MISTTKCSFLTFLPRITRILTKFYFFVLIRETCPEPCPEFCRRKHSRRAADAACPEPGRRVLLGALWDFAWSGCRTPQLVGGDTRKTRTSSGLRYATHANSQRPLLGKVFDLDGNVGHLDIQSHALKNSTQFPISSADLLTINLRMRRICSPTE